MRAETDPPPLADDPAADASTLETIVARARAQGSRALLVMRGGRLLLSRYFGADDDGSLLPAGVIARPLAAMAMGLAVAEGRVASLDVPVSRLLSEWDGDARGRITVRQLLEDTSGLETGGDLLAMLRQSPLDAPAKLFEFGTSRGLRLVMGNDFARTALGFRLQHEPGGFYNPSPANAQLIAVILERVTGMPYERFLEQKLWGPLHAGPAQLALDRRAGMPAAHCCWRATAPAMISVASLLAMDGVHLGRRILPEAWAGDMMRASRVSAESAMQLARGSIEGRTAVWATDGGHTFWVFPELQLAILNIVNPEGASDPQLPGQLLGVFGTG